MIKGKKVFDRVFTARNFNSSPLTISDLQGDTYDYELVMFNGVPSSNGRWRVRFNGDSTSNYRFYGMRGAGGTAAASANDAVTEIRISSSNQLQTGNTGLVMSSITGSSGDERYVDSFSSGDANINKESDYWKNTANEINSLEVATSTSMTLDAHIMLYRTPKASGQSSWEVMKVVDFTSRDLAAGASPIDFTVDGDQDIEYKITGSISSTNGTSLGMVLNSDTASNYTLQYLENNNGTIGAINRTDTSIETEAAGGTDNEEFTFLINAESGVERLVNVSQAQTDFTGQNECSAWWSNTVDNLTAIRLRTAATESVTGTVKLYRKRNPAGTGDTLPFEIIKTVDISGDFSAGYTFSDLLGDSVNLYKIETLFDSTAYMRMQINADTSSNYIGQILRANSGSVDASTATTTYFDLSNGNGAGAMRNSVMYLYPKSGENRPAISEFSADETKVVKQGHWWDNSVDEITSLKVFASNTNSVTGKLILSRLV